MRPMALALAVVLVASGGPALAQTKSAGPPASPSGDPVLATVNGTNITLSEFKGAVASLPAAQQFVALQNRSEFLDSMVKRELVYQEAQRLKLESDSRVEALLAKLRKEVLIQALLRQVIESAKTVDDADAESYYLDNKEKFKSPEKITASHIVLKSEEEAKTTLAALKKGQDFASLAKERSIGPRASQGGYLGSITRGEMPMEFDKVAFKLKAGTLSDVVKTPFGYHIIRVTDHTPSKQMGFSEVSDQILKRLKTERQQESVRAFLQELSKKATVEVHPELLQDLKP